MPLLFSPVVARMARPAIAVLAGSTIAFSLTAPVQADVKITSTMTSAGGGKPSTSTGTIYYKGKKVRSEADKNVILFDSEKKTVTNINLDARTYTVVPLAATANNPATRMVDMKTVVNLVPGGKTKTILGKTAKNYNYTVTIKMSFKKEMMDRLNGAGAAPQAMPVLPTIVITGENWVTEQISLPPGAGAASLAPLAAFPGMKPLIDKFATMKGVPLEATVTIRFQGAQKGGRDQTMKTVATALSEDALSDSLFSVPAGFKETAPAINPMGGPPAATAPHP